MAANTSGYWTAMVVAIRPPADTPTTYRPGHPAPLVVAVHGCQTTADTEQKITLYDQLAEKNGFVVLYPDVNADERAAQGPIANCWRFYDPASLKRDSGDAGAIADMTRAVMKSHAIDRERTYIVGVSAGGLMATTMAVQYPEVFAAIGIVESAAYGDAACFTTGTGLPVETSAQMAFDAMGSGARVVPLFVIGSTGDQAFPAPCAHKALEQGLRTNNLVVSGKQTAPIALAPAATGSVQVTGGRAYTVSTDRDPDGCLIGEKTIIDGMPHAWPGGTTDDRFKGYNDPTAPDGAGISWAFLSRYTKSTTSLPCAEAPKPCPATWKRLAFPSGATGITATVGRARATVRRTKGGVRVRVPAATPAGTRVVVTARTRDGRKLTRRATYRGCGR
jgi:poly(hydroxyalkanoate) depolymerase family esterase